jgi:hypothetical protein
MTMINAFHPLYAQTHMPQFLSTLRKESKQVEDGKLHATKSRAVRVSTKEVNSRSIDTFPKTRSAK